MTLRGTVRDGVITINTHGTLPEGAEVEVVRVEAQTNGRRPTAASKVKKKTARKTARSSAHTPDNLLDLFGMWKGRRDFKGLTTEQIHRKLRDKAMGRDRRA